MIDRYDRLEAVWDVSPLPSECMMQYKDIPVWSVTVGRPEDPPPQRSCKLTLKDMRPP